MRRTVLHGALAVTVLIATSLHGAANPDRPRRAKSSIYNTPNGTGPANWQWGKQLFWDFADTSNFKEARREADNLASSGIAPVMSAVGWLGAVDWGDTTLKVLSPSGDSVLDTVAAFQWRDPAWVAYSSWTLAHDSLTPIAPNGEYAAALDNPDNSFWIPFTIPLDSQDCPKGMKTCTYGDFAADRIGRLCARTNLAGVYAADFVDGLPGAILNQYSFHPRILKAFEDSTGIKLPEGPVSVKSAEILSKHMSEWADFWADAWGRFYADIASHVRKAGRVSPLICAQTAWDMPFRRLMAVDFRRYLRYMPSENWFFAVEMQGDNLRPMKSHGDQVALFGTYTAWEPDMPIGAKINVNDNFLNDAMLLAGKPVQHGAAMQRSQYLLVGFTHLATRSGHVRRAAQAFEYGYYDHESQVDAFVTDFLLAHFPRRPYGPALFFSKAQLHAFENAQKNMRIIEQGDSLWNIAPYGFVATEVALDSLKPESRPTAWLVPSIDQLPTEERSKLQKSAPILSADSARKASPIQATGKGRAWGFWDQESSLVVLVSNPDTASLKTTLSISGLKSGRWTASYMGIPDSTQGFNVTGNLSMAMEIAPYDTRAYVIRTEKPVSVGREMPLSDALPAQRIDGGVRGIQVLDPSSKVYRSVQGRLLLPR